MTTPAANEDAERGATTPGANDGVGTPGSWTPNDKNDTFEVAFEGGDSDPMCPRSMKTARKWLIVSVLSGAGVCL
jgi:hypothetical protein